MFHKRFRPSRKTFDFGMFNSSFFRFVRRGYFSAHYIHTCTPLQSHWKGSPCRFINISLLILDHASMYACMYVVYVKERTRTGDSDPHGKRSILVCSCMYVLIPYTSAHLLILMHWSQTLIPSISALLLILMYWFQTLAHTY